MVSLEGTAIAGKAKQRDLAADGGEIRRWLGMLPGASKGKQTDGQTAGRPDGKSSPDPSLAVLPPCRPAISQNVGPRLRVQYPFERRDFPLVNPGRLRGNE